LFFCFKNKENVNLKINAMANNSGWSFSNLKDNFKENPATMMGGMAGGVLGGLGGSYLDNMGKSGDENRRNEDLISGRLTDLNTLFKTKYYQDFTDTASARSAMESLRERVPRMYCNCPAW